MDIEIALGGLGISASPVSSLPFNFRALFVSIPFFSEPPSIPLTAVKGALLIMRREN